MPIRPLSRDEVRSIDVKAAVEWGLPTIALMENAGRGAADWLDRTMGPGESVLVACGPGNNGGDGGVLARHLDARGRDKVVVGLFADPESLRGDAAIQFAVVSKSVRVVFFDKASLVGVPDLEAFFRQFDWVVDALLGTGLSRPVAGHLFDVISALNLSGRKVVSLDIPSGLDSDTGLPLGISVLASATLTFVAPKLGFSQPGAADYTGHVHIVDIGLPRKLLAEFEPTPSG